MAAAAGFVLPGRPNAGRGGRSTRLEQEHAPAAAGAGTRGSGQPAEGSRYRLVRGLPAVLASDSLTATAMSLACVDSTVAAALAVVNGKSLALAASAKVAVLTEGVLKTMFVKKIGIVAGALIVLALVTAAIGGHFSLLTRCRRSPAREHARDRGASKGRCQRGAAAVQPERDSRDRQGQMKHEPKKDEPKKEPEPKEGAGTDHPQGAYL